MKTASIVFICREPGIEPSTTGGPTWEAARVKAQHWVLLLCLLAFAAAFAGTAATQQFAPSPALTFNSTVGGDNPLSQLITINSTGASFDFTGAASTNSGGDWLSVATIFHCCGNATPYSISIAATPASTLAAGTYTGQIIATPQSASISPLTIPVTLIVHPATAAYFDQIAGGLTYMLQTSAVSSTGQQLQIRNAGTGSLAWTASTTTADGGAWLTLSASSGTAPSNLTVSVVPSKLPGLGINAGTFTGQVNLKSSGDTATIPITVTVGDPVPSQLNPLSFTRTFDGANPLNQVITVASSGSSLNFTALVQNSTGGSWLTVSSDAFGCCGSNTPTAVVLSVNPAATLAAGTYMAQILLTLSDYSQTLIIPVSLTIDSSPSAYLDQVAGQLNFSLTTGGDAPPSQDLQIRNAGGGTLSWTAAVNTADGGSWLAVSAASGAAPANISASVNPANLPNNGLIAGSFVGQVVLQNALSRITIPVVVSVGDASFRQVNPIRFDMPYGGADALSQVIDIASTGASFPFVASVVNSTGGSWLSISPSNYGCCGLNTPQTITVNANPAASLPAGTYTAEVLVQSKAGDQALAIPVTLTVEPEPATGSFFDALPGQMSFAMVTKGEAPPAQVLPIRNAGVGTLDWTAITTTSDGGNWLSVSSDSGTAPSNPTVSVNPANLPGGGLVAGTFTGQVVLEANGNQVTIPVSMVVGASIFSQVNPLEFNMTVGGANSLPQVVTIASTGTDFAFFASTISSTGGNWLTINPATYGCCGLSTPYAIIVTVNPAVTLGAGTYSSEIIVRSADGTLGLTIPVTLNIKAATDTFFDSLPGQLTFSMAASGSAPPAQPLEIRNAGAASLAWTSTLTTSDGGKWLAISAASGTAPTVPSISIVPAKLPGGGITAGTFTGQVLLQAEGDQVTVPVTVVVGGSAFRQVNALNFNMTAGGGNPLPQLINVTSIGTAFPFFATAVNSTGGNWLQINPSSYGCCGISTPQNMIVSINPAATLAAGTYTAEIIFRASAGSPTMVVPVTLTVNPEGADYFDDMPGGVSFLQVTSGANPASQSVPIRNAGLDRLNWTASKTTSDGGNWLTIGSAAGTAPSSLTININSANLPGKGLIAGIFNGQVLLQSGTVRQTIPVQAVVGADVFEPLAPLKFTKPYGGSNPTYQVLNVNTNGASFGFFGLKATDDGQDWMTINPATFGCCGVSTPEPVQVSVDPAVTLAAGSYVGEVIFTSSAGDQGMVVPVTLTITDGTVKAATPVFSPAGGTYPAPQTVTISDSTPGAAIYYTLDGTPPTTASKVFSVPLTVTPPETVKAIAVAPGYVTSAVGSAVYSQPQAAMPSFTPVAGNYPSAQSVILTDSTSDATMYYTTDGTTPTTSSARYTGAIPVPSDETVEAIATAPGYSTSAVGAAVYTIEAATPVFTPVAGKYSSPQNVTLTDATPGATIYYTTNKTTPTTSSTVYTGAIPVTANEIIEAIAAAPNYSQSGVATASYVISAAVPSFTPAAGNYTSPQTVTLTDATPSATIYYTTNGTTPTLSSTKYTGAISVSSKETVEAIAAAPGYGTSGIGSAAYTITAATPVFTPTPGNYASAQSVTITDTTPGATIYYTTNGTAPSASSTPYTAAINLSTSTTIQAIAIATGYANSAVATGSYVIGTVAPPIFTPGTGTYSSPQSATITDATPGATIYYTIDKTTPTISSTKYTGPITVSTTTTIKAIAVATGLTNSAVATAVYTIKAAPVGVSQTITITETTPGASVYYTTDGSTPTAASTKYTGPITLTGSEVLKFIAIAPGYGNSAVRTVTDTVQ